MENEESGWLSKIRKSNTRNNDGPSYGITYIIKQKQKNLPDKKFRVGGLFSGRSR